MCFSVELIKMLLKVELKAWGQTVITYSKAYFRLFKEKDYDCD